MTLTNTSVNVQKVWFPQTHDFSSLSNFLLTVFNQSCQFSTIMEIPTIAAVYDYVMFASYAL